MFFIDKLHMARLLLVLPGITGHLAVCCKHAKRWVCGAVGSVDMRFVMTTAPVALGGVAGAITVAYPLLLAR